jgi:hypothetical protein
VRSHASRGRAHSVPSSLRSRRDSGRMMRPHPPKHGLARTAQASFPPTEPKVRGSNPLGRVLKLH